MTYEDLRQALTFELERHFPLQPDVLSFDYMLLESHPEIRVLVAAARRDLLESVLSALGSYGLEPDGLVPAPLANGELLRHCRPELAQLPQAVLVEEEPNALGMDLFAHGHPHESHVIFLEKTNGTIAIETLEKELLPVLSRVISQLESPATLPWFFLGSPDSPIQRALLDMGLAPPSPINHQAFFAPSEGFEFSQFHTATGLTLLALKESELPLNLIPPPPVVASPRRRLSLRTIAIGGTLVLALGLYISSTLYDYQQLRTLRQSVASLQTEVQEVNKLQKELRLLRTEVKALQSLITNTPSALEILRELTILIPESAWLTEVSFQESKLLISGYAQSSQELIGLLERSPLFFDIRFKGTITKRNGKERFRIAAEIE
jgi:general secretion pathway protein L